MKTKHWKVDQIIPILKEDEGGATMNAPCHKQRLVEPTSKQWRGKCGGMVIEEGSRLNTLEDKKA